MTTPSPTLVLRSADRSMRVPPGHVVMTAWVPAHQVRLACADRMAIGDIERVYRDVLVNGDHASWPCPCGYWEGDAFVLQDGRHEYLARLAAGWRTLLVAWVAPLVGDVD